MPLSLLPFLQYSILALKSWGSSSSSRVGTLEFSSRGALWEEHSRLVLSCKPFLNFPTNVSEYVADFLVDTRDHVLPSVPIIIWRQC